jgi:hypothetical protein
MSMVGSWGEYKYTGKTTNFTVKLGAPYAGTQQTVAISPASHGGGPVGQAMAHR